MEVIKYYESGEDFPYKNGHYLNWITKNDKTQEEVFRVLFLRANHGGSSARALKTLKVGFYAAPLKAFDYIRR